MSVPSYLSDYASIYAKDPRKAALAWFRQARYGLFLHYGLYSLLERHEWVQLRERIPVAKYEELAAEFTAQHFDAREIARFAKKCGMNYVNMTTRHHDSFCLFDTAETPFNSMTAPSHRDLVAELAEACASEGLGLFLYYSHGRDWRHPHAPNNDTWGGRARPEYQPPEPAYANGKNHDLTQYLEFMRRQIVELLTNYGPIAGIWLDGIAVPLSGERERFRCQSLYDEIHRMQPQVLVSYKQGLLGTEDFYTPEHQAIETNGKPGEICTTMAPGSWGYTKSAQGKHKSAQEVWETLRDANSKGFNLLLNTGPLPDGSLDPEDTKTLLEVGHRIAREGYPA